MKKQIVTTNSTHLIRAAFVLILPFLLGPALGQGNASKRSVAANLSQVASPRPARFPLRLAFQPSRLPTFPQSASRSFPPPPAAPPVLMRSAFYQCRNFRR